MLNRLKSLFIASAEDGFREVVPLAGHLRQDRVLNYVWINMKADESGKTCDDFLCSVPLHYLDGAYGNARKYDDTEVRIWIDPAYLDPMSRYFVDTHAHLEAPDNVRFMNLRTIPAYDQNEIFQPEKGTSIWTKVDLARFLVVSHCLQTTDAQRVFYADFDVKDVELDNQRTDMLLNRHGMTLGLSPENIISHGYIAVDRSGQTMLDRAMIPNLEFAARTGEGNVFHMMESVLFTHYMRKPVAHNAARTMYRASHTTSVPLTPIGSIIPGNETYAQARLCDDFFRPEPKPDLF